MTRLLILLESVLVRIMRWWSWRTEWIGEKNTKKWLRVLKNLINLKIRFNQLIIKHTFQVTLLLIHLGSVPVKTMPWWSWRTAWIGEKSQNSQRGARFMELLNMLTVNCLLLGKLLKTQRWDFDQIAYHGTKAQILQSQSAVLIKWQKKSWGRKIETGSSVWSC